MIEPRATYRIQLTPGFGFDEVAAIAPYLADLGVSHVYLSPCFQAARGSTHGYDVVDYHRVSDALGGASAHARMGDALKRHGLALLVDLVPNHMAILGEQNPWWWDVLENGPSSNYASYFDVDWEPPEARLRNTLLMPVLGDQYGRILESGQIKLVREDASFRIRYHDQVYPVAPRSLYSIFADAAERCHSEDLAFIADALDWLPLPTLTDLTNVRRRHRDKAVLGRRISQLFAEQPEVPRAIDQIIGEINANPDLLHTLLERQNYRLAFWRTAGRDLGYRRFFDINSLIGLRMEERAVFDDTHLLVLRWLAEGSVDGVRIDHIDGLRAPRQYLERIREASQNAWIVVEKILAHKERLPAAWPVAGTTGYDFLNRSGGLFVDAAGETPLTEFYAEFTRDPVDFAALAREKKQLVLRSALGSDLNRLTAMFLEVCEGHRDHRDYTRHDLHEALITTISSFPVYRTYMSKDGDERSAEDEYYITIAIGGAKKLHPDLDASLFDFLRDLLLTRVPGALESEFALRFQQLTGSTMAKAVEDTAFYCFNRLVCLNEVGGDPARFGVGLEEFMRESAEIQRAWPRTMLATSTHDTKRSEDVRARLYLISEIPDRWIAAVRRWSELNAKYWQGEPDHSAEYLFYQTLTGAWPITTDRVVGYMRKAAREGKRHTSWIDPNLEYETRLVGFIESSLSSRTFVADLGEFVEPLIQAGRINSLAQTLLKLTAPGVPDVYQGCELWDLSLVDPDNRRPVDYAGRRALLAQAKRTPPTGIWSHADSGMPKLWLIHQALQLRKRCPELFGISGGFKPLSISGSHLNRVIAYARGGGAVAIAPRLMLGLGAGWADTSVDLPMGRWVNELTGESTTGGPTLLAELLRHFPVALLTRESSRS
ncbi:MAG TPA: malto-oligosyltrehalose synthase [Candidatus Binataceae bacterium]|nr:malto-oligosyltrehalose synthase [Candidatus Binataceae bacterium]